VVAWSRLLVAVAGHRLSSKSPLLVQGECAGRLEDNPPADLDGVVGEALVKAAEQRHIDSGGDPVLPLAIHKHGEQLPVQIIHRVVLFANASRLFWIARSQHFLCAIAQFDCDSTHFSESSR
jgi:hypothetical protein